MLLAARIFAQQSASSATIGPIEDQRIAVLEAQLAAQLQFQSSLLDVVQWSLGSIVAVGALLVGYNWFTNYRNVARDKEALRGELTTGLADILAKLTVTLDEKFQTSRKELREGMEASAATLLRRSLSPLNQRIEALQSQSVDLTIDMLVAEARYWEHVRKVPANGFSKYLALLALGQEHSNGLAIRAAIVGMRENLTKMTSVFVSQAVQAKEIMAKLPSEYADEAAALSTAIQKLPKD